MRRAILAIALVMSGCVPDDQPRDLFIDGRVRLHVDRLTGCQYLVVLDRMITPRLGPDGQPICLPPARPAPTQRREGAVA